MTADTLERIPVQIQCDWKPDRERGRGVYVCATCGQWTANYPLYKGDICPEKDRRTAKRERRSYQR